MFCRVVSVLRFSTSVPVQLVHNEKRLIRVFQMPASPLPKHGAGTSNVAKYVCSHEKLLKNDNSLPCICDFRVLCPLPILEYSWWLSTTIGLPRKQYDQKLWWVRVAKIRKDTVTVSLKSCSFYGVRRPHKSLTVTLQTVRSFLLHLFIVIQNDVSCTCGIKIFSFCPFRIE